jgi:hypothetical protein
LQYELERRDRREIVGQPAHGGDQAGHCAEPGVVRAWSRAMSVRLPNGTVQMVGRTS